ncbi:MAG: hypothetical protein LBD80_02205 [Tannerella sp.]|jgi:hypothetical protein|nr:hypothetical protein [Tannerella sp.]
MKQIDYVPRKESVFYPWSKNPVKVSKANRARWGIPVAETAKLKFSFTDYETKRLIAVNPSKRIKSVMEEKSFRRVNARNQPGAWSESAISAVIA